MAEIVAMQYGWDYILLNRAARRTSGALMAPALGQTLNSASDPQGIATKGIRPTVTGS
jgi:hypothetical protein